MKFVGGLPCLDFVNTVGGWSAGGPREDKLETFADLIRWSELAGLLEREEGRALARLAGRRPSEASKALKRAKGLRTAAYGLLRRAAENRAPLPRNLAVFRTELWIARRHQELSWAGRGFHWASRDANRALDSILWRVSQSTADLLTSPDLARVRQCGGENCGWLFLDTTRNHSRHWCDMKDCGNLAKVRRFRQRRTS
jgi:predicted RNA-binding Zn ribbon-like protein